MKPASILRRLAAYLIDCILVFTVFVIGLQYALFVPLRSLVLGTEDWFRSGWNTEIYTLLTISLPIWLYFILTEASPWRATLGKKLLKIQTLGTASRNRISILQSVIRTLIKLLPWELAHATNNLPTPMWSTADPGFRLGFALVPLLIMIYLLMTQFTRHKQGPHDLAARTEVVLAG